MEVGEGKRGVVAAKPIRLKKKKKRQVGTAYNGRVRSLLEV
jgi:hypothetical protein